MYTEMAKDYDKKRAERWQKDADGILIFVRSILLSVYIARSMIIDRSIFRRCCDIAFRIDPGSPA